MGKTTFTDLSEASEEKFGVRGSLPPPETGLLTVDRHSGCGCVGAVPATPQIGSGAFLRVTFPGCEVDRGTPAVVAQERAHGWEGSSPSDWTGVAPAAGPGCSPVGHLQFHSLCTSDKAVLRPPSSEAVTGPTGNRAGTWTKVSIGQRQGLSNLQGVQPIPALPSLSRF